MKTGDVAVAECGAAWVPADDARWRAYLGCDEDLDEPAELVLLCLECASGEFGDARLAE